MSRPEGGVRPAGPTPRPPLWRRRGFWLAAAGAAAATAVAWGLAREALLAHWQGHYGNWRDLFLAVRVWQAPGFFAVLAALAVAVALLLAPAERLDRRRGEGGSPLYLWGLTAVALLVALPLSLAEWQRYGLPCWDGYCERAALWAGWFAAPSPGGLAELLAATAAFHTGASLLPPLAVGAVAALGPSVVVAFMLVDLAAWGAVGAGVARIARRHLGFGAAETAAALLLTFGHLAAMRSLLFPQTDPIALAFVVWALAANLAYLERPAAGAAGALFAVNLLGLASKLSFAPMLAVPALGALLAGGGWRRRAGDAALRGLAFGALPAAVFVTFLNATGLLPSLVFELGFIAGRDSTVANFYADNNPLRFVVVLALVVQLFPLLLAGERRALAGDPRRRLLAAVALLFLVSLVALRTAFWPRYFLPVLPSLALLAAPPLVAGSSGPLGRALLATAYVAANAAFLAFGLYY